jgi:transcriptional regulator with XRE-family HTH domain
MAILDIPEETRSTLAQLKHLRQSRGMRNKDVAEQLGISASALSKYEEFDRLPKPEMVSRITEWMANLDRQPSRVFRRR